MGRIVPRGSGSSIGVKLDVTGLTVGFVFDKAVPAAIESLGRVYDLTALSCDDSDECHVLVFVNKARSSVRVGANGPEFHVSFEEGWPSLADLVLMIVARERRDCFIVHGSAIAVNGRVAAFVGPSGRGKSTLAWACAKRGAEHIADDRIAVSRGSRSVLPVRTRIQLRENTRTIARALRWSEPVDSGRMQSDYTLTWVFLLEPPDSTTFEHTTVKEQSLRDYSAYYASCWGEPPPQRAPEHYVMKRPSSASFAVEPRLDRCNRSAALPRFLKCIQPCPNWVQTRLGDAANAVSETQCFLFRPGGLVASVDAVMTAIRETLSSRHATKSVPLT